MITLPFLPNYTILMSERTDGSFKTGDKVKAFLKHHGVKKQVGFLKLEHGSRRVHWNDSETQDTGDTVITDNPELGLSMVLADCIPIIIIDKNRKVLAMIHGGWRSLLQNIIRLTINELTGPKYKSEPEDLIVWIGPGIRKASNTSQHEPVQALFPEWQPFVAQSGDMYQVDLVGYIKHTLIECSLKAENIFDYDKDTYQSVETFFSHRRATQTGDEDGRFIVSVWKN